jgi:GntR family transcriptional regulator, rspAB operon transcriptional repressor
MARAPSRPRRYLTNEVYEALRRAIVEREFDPGEPLTEQALCRRFAVSRTPVREALARLERDHLVRVVPKKGAFVRTLSHDEIRELYQIREGLEALAVRLAAPRIDPEELRGFEIRFQALRTRGASVGYPEVRALGHEFHSFLHKSAGNSKLIELLEGIREQVRSVWTMSILAPRRAQALVREHLGIIRALHRGDVRSAEQLMGQHVRRVRDTIFRLVE